MRKAMVSGAILYALLMASCGPSEVRDDRALAAEISKADEQWAAAASKNDLDATLSFYADDAVVLPGNAPIAVDKKAIRELWAAMLGPNSAVSWKVTKAEVAKSGELGYLYGTYELTIRDAKGGPPVHDTGKLVEIWKKQADGKWRCIVDTYNSDLPLPAAGAAQK